MRNLSNICIIRLADNECLSVNNTKKIILFGFFSFVFGVWLQLNSVVRSGIYLCRSTIVCSISVRLMGVHRNVFKRMPEQSTNSNHHQQQQQVDTRLEAISAHVHIHTHQFHLALSSFLSPPRLVSLLFTVCARLFFLSSNHWVYAAYI